MQAIISVKRNGEWFVATDLITHITDQGRTKKEALRSLGAALRGYYETLSKLIQKKDFEKMNEIEAAWKDIEEGRYKRARVGEFLKHLKNWKHAHKRSNKNCY